MDSAPLTTAHILAREASDNTPTSSQIAIEKHKAAAGEFARAAADVEDSEALRVLNLLEQHHRRLAQIISSPSDHARSQSRKHASTRADHTQREEFLPSSTNLASAIALQHAPESTTRKTQESPVRRRPGHDLSSSIASNLATARGIPHTQLRRQQATSLVPVKESIHDPVRQSYKDANTSRATQSERRLGSLQKTAVRGAQLTSTSVTEQPIRDSTQSAIKSDSDDPFQKFYSTFEGLLSKLSAPLAFAGLPLVPDEAHEAKSSTTSTLRKAAPDLPKPSTSPDISKIFSKAALQAVKEDHGSLGVQESFFVVPVAGGTVSYAGVLSHAERQARHHSLETPLAEAVVEDQRRGHNNVVGEALSSKSSDTALIQPVHTTNKTTEELEIENDSLKQLTDNLSRRLYMWEKSAQSQSMALQQSIRSLQHPGRGTAEAARNQSISEHDPDSREVQEQLLTAQKELERVARENEKLTAVVQRYRQRWQVLKDGARARREGTAKVFEEDVAAADTQ